MNDFTSRAVSVRGRSMEPCLFEGDLVQITPLQGDSPEAGGLYAYEMAEDGVTVSHRCIREEDGFFVFQGDRQPHSELIPRHARFYQLESVLDRLQEPEPKDIVFGLLKQIDQLDGLQFPRHTTLHWPWEKLFAFAQRHRVLTAFAWCLKKTGLWLDAPENIRQLLQLDLYQSALRAEQVSRVIDEITQIIPGGRFLKGAALRQTLYPSPELRPMADVDYLVPELDFFPCLARLQAQGFSLSPGWRHTAEFFHEAALVHNDTQLELELHRAIFQKHRYRFDSGHFLTGTDPLDELLYLCAHALTHFGSHGLGYWEIYRYLKTQPVNLAQAAERARERGCALAFAFALRVVKSWWNEDFEAKAEILLNRRQRACLAVADFFYLEALDISMQSTRKRILMALLADELSSLTRMVLDPTRLRMSYSSKV